MKITFGSLLALLFGLSMVAISAADSVDFHTYDDWFNHSWTFDLTDIYGLAASLWSSAAFFIIFGPLNQIAPLLPYFVSWIVFWAGLTLYGYRGVHWFVFFAFFPGLDLVVNVIRQELALGLILMVIGLGLPRYIGFAAIFIHSASLMTLGFVYVERVFHAMFSGRPLRALMVLILILGGLVLAVNLPFLGTGIAKLESKVGASSFGQAFILFVYVQFFLLGVFCLFIPNKAQRIYYLLVVAACLGLTFYEILFYRFIYSFYPFLIFAIGDTLAISLHKKFGFSSWITIIGRYSILSFAGAFVLLSVLR